MSGPPNVAVDFKLFFGSNPVLYIFAVLATALNKQLIGSATDLLSTFWAKTRWFFVSRRGSLLGYQYGGRQPRT